MSSPWFPRSSSYRPTLFCLASSLWLSASFSSCTPCEPIGPLKPDPPPVVTTPPPPPKPSGPTEADARAFMDQTETQLRAMWSYAQRVQFAQNTNITTDTEQLNAQAHWTDRG